MGKYVEIAGSGRLRVTTQADVKRARAELVKREVTPLEGTNMSLFHTAIPSFWAEHGLSSTGSWMPGNAQLAERVWVADRCIQLNSQQIASMPLRHGGGGDEPAWVSNPDPNWFPNGIGDAVHKIVSQVYGWGFSCQYVTSYYANDFPRTWTVLDSSAVNIKMEDGQRVYTYGQAELDARRVVQIDRNPGGLHGTSALRSYAQNAWGLLAAGNQSMTVNQGGIPTALLKPQKKVTAEQATAIQEQWVAATSTRGAWPAIIPPDLEFVPLSFNPKDLALLDTQEWNSRILATAFGVPSVILNMALQGGLTYQNPMALMQMWWLTELRTTAKKLSDAFTAQMLPSGQWVWIDATDITTEVQSADDPQLSPVVKASPAQQNGMQPARLKAIGGSP